MADTLRDIGAQMANVMFNLAQRPGDALAGDHVATMDSLRKQWDAAVRAAAPSPGTAPEADPEKDFSDWMERRGALGAGAVPERIFFAGHSAGRRSALASRPAEVDDEGLPPLPEPFENWDPRYEGADCPVFTAEQYRQGQRDAVAADRAREWFVVGGRRIGRTYMAKLAHDAARYRWLRESNNIEAVSILDMHSGDSMDARVDQAMALAAAQPGAK